MSSKKPSPPSDATSRVVANPYKHTNSPAPARPAPAPARPAPAPAPTQTTENTTINLGSSNHKRKIIVLDGSGGDCTIVTPKQCVAAGVNPTKSIKWKDEEKKQSTIKKLSYGYREQDGIIKKYTWDPRGFRDDDRERPKTYCSQCRCPEDKCHNTLFGQYIQLMIVHCIYTDRGCPMNTVEVEDLFHDLYNDVLRFKIFEATQTLDMLPGGYRIPNCLCDISLESSLAYVRSRSYHRMLHRSITEGYEIMDRGELNPLDSFYETNI